MKSLIFCTAIFALVGVLWVQSWMQGWSTAYSTKTYTYALTSQHGRIALSRFSMVAEDEDYKQWECAYWRAQAGVMATTGGALWWVARRSRRRRARGFPVQ